jgi:spermidine synthase
MKKWTCLDSARTPDGKTISLNEHDGEYAIRIDGAELMSTRRHASEEKAAELACAHAASVAKARVLIGGLGFGFTLKAALALLRPDATVVVAEILPAIIAWNRNPAWPLAANALNDPRVSLTGDVGDAIRAASGAWHSIVMDVDNGPAALSAASNHRLYDPAGLRATRLALRRGGCVAYWSAFPDPGFEKSLARAGFTVDVHPCRAHAHSGAHHFIFTARSSSPPA